MTRDPIPQPLGDVLRNVLHANLFATWRTDLTAWVIAHPAEAQALRRQIAVCALNDAVDPEAFRRLTGHSATHAAQTQAWFADLFQGFYGRKPEAFDAEPPAR
jgi:hypothetical protein